jgi:hypothetical protein
VSILAGESEESMEQGVLFAHVNDSIRRLVTSDGLATETWDFYCECADVGCRSMVRLTVDEFDRRRSFSPPLPVLATEHGEAV